MTRIPGINEDGTFQSSVVNDQIDARAASRIAKDISTSGTPIRDLLELLLGSNSGVFGIRIEDYGGLADGTTDDSDAMASALSAASESGTPLVLPKGKTIRLTKQVRIPSNVEIQGGGCTLHFTQTTGSGAWLLNFNTAENVTVRNLKCLVNTDTNLDQRGVTAVAASNLVIDNFSIEATKGGTAGDSMNKIGMFFQNCPRLSVNNISVKNWDYAMKFDGIEDTHVDDFTIQNYRTGLWITDCAYVTFSNGLIHGKSPNTAQDNGHNGVLMSSNTAAYSCKYIRLVDIVLQDSGATGFRLGGQLPIAHVDHVRCRAKNVGSNGFKTLGGTLESRSRHRNINYFDCSAESCGTVGVNTAGIAIHLTDDVRITNFFMDRDSSQTTSGGYGLNIQGANKVTVTNPTVLSAQYAAFAVNSNLGDVNDVTLDGGRFTATEGDIFLVNCDGISIRRLQIVGHPAIEHYGNGFILNSSVTGGRFIGRPLVTFMVTTSSTSPTLFNGAGVGQFMGDIRAAYSSAIPNSHLTAGSIWQSNSASSTNAFGVKKSNGWTWL